mmetsp:Transcript_48097/g.139327  ORF Transcript_48097/g.139327 Transcript_48097/m.139327 type:complete len:293 (+) Transcript_48097:1832-2710(+)
MHGPLLVGHLEVCADEPLLAGGDLGAVALFLGSSEVHLGLPEDGLGLAQHHVGGHSDVPRLNSRAHLAALLEERPRLLRNLQSLFWAALGQVELGQAAHSGGLPRLVLDLLVEGYSLIQGLRHLICLVALQLGHAQLVPGGGLALLVRLGLAQPQGLLRHLQGHLLLAPREVAVQGRPHGLRQALVVLQRIKDLLRFRGRLRGQLGLVQEQIEVSQDDQHLALGLLVAGPLGELHLLCGHLDAVLIVLASHKCAAGSFECLPGLVFVLGLPEKLQRLFCRAQCILRLPTLEA